MSDLILHYAIPSRGFVTHWMLEEIGQPFERRVLDFDLEEQKTPEFLALNPMGKVPVLEHGNRVVTETTAICLYLAEQFPALEQVVHRRSALLLGERLGPLRFGENDGRRSAAPDFLSPAGLERPARVATRAGPTRIPP